MGKSEVQHDSGRDRLQIFIFLALLLLALVIRLLLAGRAIWYDERFTLANTTSLTQAIEHCHKDVNPPLYFLLITAWRAALPSTELSMRLLSVIFGMASLAGIYLIGRSIAGRKAGLVGLAIAALSPYHWLFSTELRPYALLLAFSAFSTWAFLEILKTGAPRYFVVLALSTVLNLYSHYFAVFLLLAQAAVFIGLAVGRSAAGTWPARDRNRQVIMGILTVGVIAAAYAPWVRSFGSIVTDSIVAHRVVGAGRRLGAGVTFKLLWNAIFGSLGWGIVPFCLQVPLVVWALVAPRVRQASLVFGAVWVLPFAVLTIWEPAHFIAPKYFLFTYPLTVGLVAAGVDLAAEWLRVKGVGANVAVLALASAVSLSPLIPGQHPPYAFHRDDWKRIISDLPSYMRPGDRICLPNDVKSLAMVQYYGGTPFFEEYPLLTWYERDKEKGLEPFLSGTDVWILTQLALPGVLASGLGEGIEAVRTWDVYPMRITLYHWVPARAVPAPGGTREGPKMPGSLPPM